MAQKYVGWRLRHPWVMTLLTLGVLLVVGVFVSWGGALVLAAIYIPLAAGTLLIRRRS
jgi:predicted histidine transporter YuiF (NhaC family)